MANNWFNANFIFGSHIVDLIEKLVASVSSTIVFKGKSQKPTLRSEPLPKSNDGPIKVAVGENFKEVVNDSGRDAFIEFYSPYCRHCIALEPTWDGLGKKMKNEDVDIAKIDAIHNQWPDSRYVVHGYPTIYWKFADNTKAPMKYTNQRTTGEFIKFMAVHATNELKGWDRHGKPKKRTKS